MEARTGTVPVAIPLPAGRLALESGDVETALASARARLAQRPDDPWALLLLGDGLQRRGEAGAARSAYEGASRTLLPLANDDQRVHLHDRVAHGLLRTGSGARAIEHFEVAVALAPERADLLASLGSARAVLGRPSEAIAPLERAIELGAAQPGSFPAAEASLVAALEATNQLERAGEVLAGLLETAPDDPTALLARAVLDRRAGRFEEARAGLADLLARDLDAATRERVLCQLVPVLDRCGAPSEAFAAARAARASVAASAHARAIDHRHYPNFVARVHRFAARWIDPAPAEPAPVNAPPGDAPIFVVGFPRSGTTLVEHVLGALPGVATSDEAPFVDHVVRNLPRILGRDVSYPECIDELHPVDVQRIRASYAAIARDLRGSAEQFVDKNPWNLLHAPFLRTVFPESPIVVVLRDPRDACLSAFLQDFRPNAATVHLLSIEGAAELCSSVLGAFAAMRERLLHHEVRYESLVTDFEAEARRLVAWTGLAFDRDVLRFHERAVERVVSTPSRGQVAQPVSGRSVERWRAYADELAGVLPNLAECVREMGYEAD